MKLLFILFSVCSFSLGHGASGVNFGGVTLQSDVTKKDDDSIKWYFNDTLIARLNGDPSKTCTDVQCNGDNKRFRDRLKLNHQTGSLTITNTTTTDSGLYQLVITNRRGDSEKIFNVSFHEKSAKKGESVTLDTSEVQITSNAIELYFKGILVAKITGDQSKICTDNHCDEKFRDRLNLDNQTRSLIITNTRTTDTGCYQLSVTSSNSRRRRSSSSSSSSKTNVKSFAVTVIDSSVPDSSAPGSGLSPAAIGISAAVVVVVLFAAVGGINYSRRSPRKVKCVKAEMEKNKINCQELLNDQP